MFNHAPRLLGWSLQVNDAYRGTLSSYGYVLMCIHLLQQRQPPVLPCLHNIRPHTHVRRAAPGCCTGEFYMATLGSMWTAFRNDSIPCTQNLSIYQ